MRLLLLGLAVLLGSTAAQHFSQPLDPPNNQLHHSEVALDAVEDRPFSQHRSLSPIHSKVIFGTRLDPRPSQKAGIHSQSESAVTISETSNRRLQSMTSDHLRNVHLTRFQIGTAKPIPIVSRQLQPPMRTKTRVRTMSGLPNFVGKTTFSQRNVSQNKDVFETNVSPIQSEHSFFDIFWATADKNKKTNFHSGTKIEQSFPTATNRSQSFKGDRISASSRTSSTDHFREENSDGRLENHFKNSFREQSSPNYNQRKSFEEIISSSSLAEIPQAASAHANIESDIRYGTFSNSNTESELETDTSNSTIESDNVHYKSQMEANLSPTRHIKKIKSYLPLHLTLEPKVVHNYLPPAAPAEPKIEQTYLLPSTTSKPQLLQNYLPPVTASEPKIEQTYLPPSTTSKPHLIQNYLPPVTASEPRIEQTYLPLSTTSKTQLLQNYLPPVTASEPKIEQTYLPPSTTSKPQLIQIYLPPVTASENRPEQTYLPPSTTSKPQLLQNYLPLVTASENRIEQTYIPPSSTSKPQLIQNYLPPVMPSEPKIEQIYLPPSTTSEPQLFQDDLPHVTPTEPKTEQTYLPPSTTSKPQLLQNYLPPVTASEPKFGQTYLPPFTATRPKKFQNYLPPTTTSPTNYLPSDSKERNNFKLNQVPLFNSMIHLDYGTESNEDGSSREASFSAFIPVIAVVGDERRTFEVPISALRGKKNSLEVSSYSDYTRSDLSVQRQPFSVTAFEDEFEDEHSIVPFRGINSQQSFFFTKGGENLRRQPYAVVTELDTHSSMSSTNRLRGHSECSSNHACKDSELCSDGKCVKACLLARGRCVGQSTCSTRRHTAACVCPESFSSVILRESGGVTRYDCMPMSMMTLPRVSHRKFFGFSSSSRLLSSSYSSLLPTRHSTPRISSAPVRGPTTVFRQDGGSSSSEDPCRPSPCGPNTRCDVNARGIAQCKCLDNFVPDGHTINGCKPQCVSDFECPDDYRCRQTKCERVCVPGACGLNADCDGRGHRAICSCPAGYNGNADVTCSKIVVKLRAAPPAPPADPCFPSPCGRDAECKERDGRAVCSCPYGYEGDPLDTRNGCVRAECLQSSDCDRSKACQGQKCIDPCGIPDICGRGSDCTVRDHQPVCSCGNGFTGDPFVACRRFDPQELCDPSPCAANTNCRVQNDRAVCSCIENYIGDPLDGGCRAECVSDRDCPGDRTCRENRCSNPCAYSACGEGAYCDVRNNRVTCTCPKFFQGNAQDRCYAECTAHEDCRSHEACFELKCVDPCVGACGTGADCKVEEHKPICSCPRGYTGHPFESCRPFTEADLCNPNPCGSGADCTPGHDRAGESRPVCTCPVGNIGNPLVACERGECQRPEDCGAEETCHAYHCQSPCVTETGSVCGELADCIVRNHQPVCSCPPGYEGNPLKECFTGAVSRFHAGRT